ncbi:MAG: serine/threonine protein kinase [Planctomycetes bacterium]|nr:serine/threonine protein kinase [Planctomycetota bacterium]
MIDAVREHLWGQLLLERRLVTPEDHVRLVAERDAALRRGQACTLGQLLVARRGLDGAQAATLAREVEARGRACHGCRLAFLAAGPEPAPVCPTCGGPAGLSRPPAAGSARPPAPGASGRLPAVGPGTSGRLPAVEAAAPGPRASARLPAAPASPAPSASELAETAPASGSADGASGAAALVTGRRFGPYVVVRELGRGGMGVVYEVRRDGAEGALALKVLLGGEFASPRLLARFRDEARLASKLVHPHIVAVHDAGDVDGVPYYVMDLVEGSDLQHLLREGLPLRRGVELLAQAARAAHHAHEHGVVHRDLKPSNILVSSAGAAYLMDFGLAKDLDDDKGLTRSGVAIGTPYYMPPEQALGRHRELDARADVYALGAILYELLARRVPFQAPTVAALTKKIIEEEPTPPGQVRPGVPPELEAVCLLALRKGREDRYPTALALALDLERWLAGAGVSARPEPPWTRVARRLRRHRLAVAGACALALVAAGVAAVQARHRAGSRPPRRRRGPRPRARPRPPSGRGSARRRPTRPTSWRPAGSSRRPRRRRGLARALEARQLTPRPTRGRRSSRRGPPHARAGRRGRRGGGRGPPPSRPGAPDAGPLGGGARRLRRGRRGARLRRARPPRARPRRAPLDRRRGGGARGLRGGGARGAAARRPRRPRRGGHGRRARARLPGAPRRAGRGVARSPRRPARGDAQRAGRRRARGAGARGRAGGRRRAGRRRRGPARRPVAARRARRPRAPAGAGGRRGRRAGGPARRAVLAPDHEGPT